MENAGDPAIAAAWHVFMETEDFNDLVDTMLRILRREARLAGQGAADPRVDAIAELVRVGKLQISEGTGLVAILKTDHKVSLQSRFLFSPAALVTSLPVLGAASCV